MRHSLEWGAGIWIGSRIGQGDVEKSSVKKQGVVLTLFDRVEERMCSDVRISRGGFWLCKYDFVLKRKSLQLHHLLFHPFTKWEPKSNVKSHYLHGKLLKSQSVIYSGSCLPLLYLTPVGNSFFCDGGKRILPLVCLLTTWTRQILCSRCHLKCKAIHHQQMSPVHMTTSRISSHTQLMASLLKVTTTTHTRLGTERVPSPIPLTPLELDSNFYTEISIYLNIFWN